MSCNKVEQTIWSLDEQEFEEVIKFIPHVQRDAYSVIFFLKMRIRDVVRVKGKHISEDGIHLGKKIIPWPQIDNTTFLSLKSRLLNTARGFPQARFFEARKPILKAKDDLCRGFIKGLFRQSKYGKVNTSKGNSTGKLPNFIVLGVPKAATTWIYQCLDEHPKVFVPDKELEFFRNYRYHYGINWYEQQFAGWQSEKAGGDVSIGYFQSLNAPQRMCKHLDCQELKLIVLLREPIDRALSYYEMRVLKGEMLGSFEDTLKIPYYRQLYIETGHYAKYFENYLKYFSCEQILVLLYEEIRKDPDHVMEKVFDFIGVNPDHQVNTIKRKSNVGKTIKNPNLHYAFTKFGYFLQVAIPWFGIGIRLRDYLIKISQQINFYQVRRKYQIDPCVYKQLKEEFQPSNEKLARIAEIDLSLWS